MTLICEYIFPHIKRYVYNIKNTFIGSQISVPSTKTNSTIHKHKTLARDLYTNEQPL